MDSRAVAALRSPETWRAFRLSLTTYERPDLTGADLTDAQIPGVDLTDVRLARANLTDANLSRAILTGADLAGARLLGADLSNADLDGADLADARLSRATLAAASLRGAVLSGAQLASVDLSSADLTDAYLVGANLVNAQLRNAILDQADLSRAVLDSANLAETSLVGVNFYAASLVQASLADADLTDAFLSRANTARTYLTPATRMPNGESLIDFAFDRPRQSRPRGSVRIQISNLPDTIEAELLADLATATASLTALAARIGASVTQRFRGEPDAEQRGGTDVLVRTDFERGEPIVVRSMHFGSPWFVDIIDTSQQAAPYLGSAIAGVLLSNRVAALVVWLAVPAERRRYYARLDADTEEELLRQDRAASERRRLLNMTPTTPAELRARLAEAGVPDAELDQLTNDIAPLYRQEFTIATSPNESGAA